MRSIKRKICFLRFVPCVVVVAIYTLTVLTTTTPSLSYSFAFLFTSWSYPTYLPLTKHGRFQRNANKTKSVFLVHVVLILSSSSNSKNHFSFSPIFNLLEKARGIIMHNACMRPIFFSPLCVFSSCIHFLSLTGS